MPYFNSTARDLALDWVRTTGTTFHWCSAEPTSYANVATVSLGSAAVTLEALSTSTGNGRQVTMPDIADVVPTGDGDATHWCLTDGAGVLVVAGPSSVILTLTTGQAVNVNGGTVAELPNATAAA